MRKACDLGIALNLDSVPMSPLTRRIGEKLAFDPLHLISSGMLVAVVPPEKAEEAQAALKKEGVDSSIIGRFIEPRGTCKTNMAEELWNLLARPSKQS